MTIKSGKSDIQGMNIGVVYHGGRCVLTQNELKGVMYFSTYKVFCEGYSIKRHSTEAPQITDATITIKNSALYEVVKEVVIKLGYDFDSDSLASFIERKGVAEELKNMGYDGAVLYDFGFRSDFNEVDVYIVFDAENQVVIIEQKNVMEE